MNQKTKIVKLKYMHDNGVNVFNDNHYFSLLIDNIRYTYENGVLAKRPSMTIRDTQWTKRKAHTFAFSEKTLDVIKDICDHSRFAIIHSRGNDKKIVKFCECKLKCFPDTEIIFDGKA